VVARQSIGARMPTSLERRHLEIRGSQPVLTMTRMAFDASGNAVEFGDHSYRASDYTIDLMVDECRRARSTASTAPSPAADQRRVRQAGAGALREPPRREPNNLDRQDFGSPDYSFLTHLHNGHTAPESDGNPHYSMTLGPKHEGYEPGEWVDNLYLNWPAGGDDREKQSFFWFHDHRMDHTGSNVYKGMVGLYPIYDPKTGMDMGDENQGLRLPGVRTDNPTAPSTSTTTSRWRSTTAGSTTASPAPGHPRTSSRREPADAPGVVGQDVLQALPQPRLRRRHLHRQRHGVPGAGGQAAQVPVPLPRRLDLADLRVQADELDPGPEGRRTSATPATSCRASTGSRTASSA
jgi:hypothetical protein